jgi:hypothetical protein
VFVETGGGPVVEVVEVVVVEDVEEEAAGSGCDHRANRDHQS